MKILVIDDDRDQRAAMGLLLRALGHEVAVAEGGSVAVDMAELLQPQLAILDFQMPGMNGYDTARALRQLPGGEAMRIVMLSGSYMVSAENAIAAGCDAFLRKPARLGSVVAALKDAMQPRATAAGPGLPAGASGPSP